MVAPHPRGIDVFFLSVQGLKVRVTTGETTKPSFQIQLSKFRVGVGSNLGCCICIWLEFFFKLCDAVAVTRFRFFFPVKNKI